MSGFYYEPVEHFRMGRPPINSFYLDNRAGWPQVTVIIKQRKQERANTSEIGTPTEMLRIPTIFLIQHQTATVKKKKKERKKSG